MAKTKKTTTIEESEEEAGISQEIDYKKDIEGKSLKEIANHSKGGESETFKDPEKDPEKAVIEEVKEPEVDLEENNRKIAEEASKKTRDEIADLIKGDTKEETKTNKDEYREWADEHVKKTGKQPDYTDAFEFLEDRAFKRLEEKQQATVKANEEARTKQVEQEKTWTNELSALIDESFDELYSANKITKIKNPDDPNDPGVQEKVALVKTMYDVNVKRAAEGKRPIYDMARIHSIYYKPVNRQPAGANAMITNARSGSGPADDGEVNYIRDIKGKSWRSFFRR